MVATIEITIIMVMAAHKMLVAQVELIMVKIRVAILMALLDKVVMGNRVIRVLAVVAASMAAGVQHMLAAVVVAQVILAQRIY